MHSLTATLAKVNRIEMLEKSNSLSVLSQDKPACEGGVSENRRRLMRAGLVAAPVILTLKSRSVLATGGHQCVKPSAFSSLQAANLHLSHRIENSFVCYSHGYWINHNHPTPYFDKKKSFFLAAPTGAPSGSISAGFAPDVGGQFQGKTLQDVLTMGGGGNIALARHTVGTFLTAVAYGDDPTKVLLTTSQCRQLWSSLAVVGGAWSPFSGANWNLADTLAYFNYIYGS